MPITLTRQEMKEKFSRVFSPEQSASLVEVLDEIRAAEIERAADTRELKQGLTALTKEVRQLAEAQRRTDERLAAFQQHTDERFAELGRVVGILAESVQGLQQAVGGLANRFGFDLEEFVAALLPPYLERHYDISNLTLERRYFDLGGGREEEVDLVGEGEREGRPVMVLAECRTTIGGSELRRLAGKLKDVAATLEGREIVLVVVAMNVHPTAEEVGGEEGVLVVPYSRINRERG